MALRRKKLKSKSSRIRAIDKTFGYVGHTILFLYALYLLCVWVSLRPTLFIDSIVVEGTHASSGQSVYDVATAKLSEQLVFWVKRNNQLLYPVRDMEQEVRALSPRIKNSFHICDTRKIGRAHV